MSLLSGQKKRHRQEDRARRRAIKQQGFVVRSAEGARYSYSERPLPRHLSVVEQKPPADHTEKVETQDRTAIGRLIFRKEYIELDRWNESNGANEISREVARGAMKRTLGWGAVTASSIGALFASGSESLTTAQQIALFAAGIGGTIFGGAKISVNACMNTTAVMAMDLDRDKFTTFEFRATLDGFHISANNSPVPDKENS